MMMNMRFTSIAAMAGLSIAAPLAVSSAIAASAPVAKASEEVLSPAQIAVARPVVEKIFPAGTYRRMMGESMTSVMDAVLDGAMTMPVADLARIGGLPVDQVAEMDKSTLADAMAIIDPNFRQRTRSGMDAIMGAMADLMNSYEPRVRDALTRAYARKFSAAQLGELNAFFATPTGSAYAAESMMIFMDKEVIGEMQALMPDMMKQMPDLVAKAEKATSALPPPRKMSELSKQDRTRLAKLLGVKEKDLKDREASHDEGGHDHYGVDDAAGVTDVAAEEGTE